MEIALAGAAFVLAVGNAFVSVLLLREVGALKQQAGRKTGLALNSPLPGFTAPTLDGGTLRSSDLMAQLLLFVSPDCGPCHELLGTLAAYAPAERPPLSVAISRREAFDPKNGDGEFVSKLSFLDPSRVFVDENRRIFNELRVPVTPFVYVLGANGRVRGSGSPKSAGELRDLAEAIS